MRILRGLSSRLLACGCVAGVYETYDGRVVAIIDAPGADCTDERHVRGKILPADDRESPVRSTSSDPR
jgi:hypothetical protein